VSNFKKRLALTLTCIPILIFSIFWPQKSHILIILIYGITITIIGSYEYWKLISKKGISINSFFIPFINTSIYTFAYFYANNFFNIQKYKITLILFILYIFIVFSYIYAQDILKKNFSLSFEKIAYTFLGLIYIGLPSFFIPFILNISPNPGNPAPIFCNIESSGTLVGSILGFYLVINVFSNDIFSYVFGIAFGRSNVIKLEASPNKSWAGYIGGFICNVLWIIVFYILFDIVLKFMHNPLWFYLTMAVISGMAVPVGDLVESVIKRSVNVKDSGSIVMGRGGILDSVDSILYFTPIYFIYLQIYFALT
jgi:phosphatidate cytidylyltransferase